MQILLHLTDPRHLAHLAAVLARRGDTVHTAETLAQLRAVAAGFAFEAVAAEYSAEVGEWAEGLEDKRIVFLTERSLIPEVASLNPGTTVLPLPGTALALRCALSPDAANDPACRLGDYQLVEIEALGRQTHLFSAMQVSIARPVVLHLLNQEYDEDDASLQAFLGDARAKAAVSHDRIGTVYQALEEGMCIFYTAERMSGPTLTEWARQNRRLPVRLATEVVRVLSSAIQHLESRQLCSGPIELRHIHLGGSEHNIPKLANTAIDGACEPGHHARVFQHALAGLRTLIDPLDPGSVKLLPWLDGLIRLPAEQVNLTQLTADVRRHAGLPGSTTPEAHSVASAPAAAARPGKSPRTMVAVVAALVAVVLVAIVTLKMRPKGDEKKGPEGATDLGTALRVMGGDFEHPQRGPIHVAAFNIDKYEVTIGEYAAFLDELAKGDPVRFDHPNQPKQKSGHKPEDWEAIRAAAAQGGTFKKGKLTLDCPVFNVDWWDAYAYAASRKRRLPTEDEWELACGGKKWMRYPWGESWQPGQANSSDKPEGEFKLWSPVNLPPTDVSADGVMGLAGNVSEWTDSEQVHPEFPDRMAPVVKGGSFLTNGSIDSHSHVRVLNKNEFQPWLGFRTAATLGSTP